ncbi:MATE family efflux transporter [Lacrimispora sp. 210928-DFI.3.58]|uniref:MATE family efflux transporter n=1 Tax=Lacrimispora sp. 210928-DFI.3.58 TaxID=2883214 RepID=UPI0015B5B8EA|nr:MATE family efflux transporter [Lacrimispora sp. 210928-DFI.3.58]MCB7318813.1 MATE family efflux transporter [Lacrimispora sp. 210928-DFI.3.58]
MAGAQRAENPLSQNFDMRSLLQFAFPTIIMMIFMGLYTIADTIFVSRFVNTNALSALNIVCPVINLIVGLGTMLATGGNAIVARKMGAGEEERARKDFTLIVLAGAILGIMISGLGVVFIDNIVNGLGANEILFPYCREYLLTLLLFTPANILQVLFQNLIVTAGHPGLGMVLSVSAGAVNIMLDYVFMVLFDMGIKGAALGTGIGYLLPAMIGIGFFSKSKGSLYFEKPVADRSVLAESCTNGCSEMVSQGACAVTTFLFNMVMMKLLGEHGVAAITIMIYTQFLLTTLYIGFSMGVAPIISYHYGGGDNLRLKKIFRICLRFISVVSVVIFLLSLVFASPLVAVFSPKGTQVYEIARKGFCIVPFSFLICGFNIFTSAAFTALSNGKLSAILSFLRTFGLITIFLLILPVWMGVTGVWLAVPAAEFMTFIAALILIRKNKDRYQYL